jgi:hypothetical protein
VNSDQVAREVQYARRMFADNGWPVIDVSRRSIEETAAAVINLYNERQAPAVRKRPDPTRSDLGDTRIRRSAREKPAMIVLASQSASRKAMLDAAGIAYEARSSDVDEGAIKRELIGVPGGGGDDPGEAKALPVSVSAPGKLCSAAIPVEVGGRQFDKPVSREGGRAPAVLFRPADEPAAPPCWCATG